MAKERNSSSKANMVVVVLWYGDVWLSVVYIDEVTVDRRTNCEVHTAALI